MHLALLHDGRPALLRVEGLPGAPAALFFHPFPLHADAWEEMLAACASSGLCAAALDAPGFGGTPPLGHTLTMEYLAELGAAALDALGAKRAALVGCSMGGYAAMAFARRFLGRAICRSSRTRAPSPRCSQRTCDPFNALGDRAADGYRRWTESRSPSRSRLVGHRPRSHYCASCQTTESEWRLTTLLMKAARNSRAIPSIVSTVRFASAGAESSAAPRSAG